MMIQKANILSAMFQRARFVFYHLVSFMDVYIHLRLNYYYLYLSKCYV